MKILFASSEAHPLIKTGGLADVSGSLPIALKRLNQDVRLVLPAYRAAREAIGEARQVATLDGVPGHSQPVHILQGLLPGSKVPVYLVDSPLHFDRAGDPYRAPDGNDWQDNDLRFAVFNHALVALALDTPGLGWRPDVLHCNDWQTGLAPALLALQEPRPATVFTIHNMAYQGLFPGHRFTELALPPQLWAYEGVEFYGMLSFIKGGIAFADQITTVSPTYAREIQTPAFGYGLDGLLRHRSARLTGILNGIDCKHWNPAKDTYLKAAYTRDDRTGKAADKRALQALCGLPVTQRTPVIGHVGRLVGQKGVDLILGALPPLLGAHDLQLVVLGSGETRFQAALKDLAARFPTQVSVTLGYNEARAHQIEAGADLFLMPSRFEPCGLNQMYSLRYGTPPVVRRTGGLADTVVDATEEALADATATGFVFDSADPHTLEQTLSRALRLYHEPPRWEALVRQGMAQDFCWEHQASAYLRLYKGLR